MIRAGTFSDCARISEIYNEAVRISTASFALEEESVADREAWFGHHGPLFPIFVYEVDGEVAGWASLSRYQLRGGYRFTVESSIYIASAYHRRGIGLALMERVVESARDLGYHSIIAGITAEQTASVGLHERLGFTKVAHFREVGFKFDRWLDVVQYQLMLGDTHDEA
jgi:phosphinothricin acetyltransferase